MKVILPATKLGVMGDYDYVCLLGVELAANSMYKDEWGDSIIIEVDDHYTLYCKLTNGWAPIEITELEYATILRDNRIFLSKERNKSLT